MVNKIIQENLEYQTSLELVEVKKRLNKIFREKRSTALYEGEFKGNKFHMGRLIDYRNNFIPQIYGELTANESGTYLKVKMKLTTFVSVFITIWIAISIGFNYFLFANSNFEDIDWQFRLFPFFGVALAIIPFKIETNKSKKFIENLLEAKKVN